jgi:hypothetical protein
MKSLGRPSSSACWRPVVVHVTDPGLWGRLVAPANRPDHSGETWPGHERTEDFVRCTLHPGVTDLNFLLLDDLNFRSGAAFAARLGGASVPP